MLSIFLPVTVTARAPGVLSMLQARRGRRHSQWHSSSACDLCKQSNIFAIMYPHPLYPLMPDWSLGSMATPTCKGGQESKCLVMGGGEEGSGNGWVTVCHGSPLEPTAARFWPIADFERSRFQQILKYRLDACMARGTAKWILAGNRTEVA